MLAPDAIDVILRDGRTLRLRPPRAADRAALIAFFRGLSQQSLYFRFHGLCAVDDRLVQAFLEPNWEETGAILAEHDGRVVALASWERLRSERAAEVAFAVADGQQGLGLGTRMLEQLAHLAGGAGVERFSAQVLRDNRAMLAVFADAGFEARREAEGGAIEVEFPVAATFRYQERVDERDHVAVRASLRPFFEPRTVVVCDAHWHVGSLGREVLRHVLLGDFDGAVHPIDPSGASVSGVRSYPTVAEVPGPVDLAVVCSPADAAVAAAEAALDAGVRAICVVSEGFAESGQAGAARQRRLLELVRAHGARLIGPNGFGLAVAGPRLDATVARHGMMPGPIGFSSQSGAIGAAVVRAASARGLGFSALVSVGNKADVSSNDLLEWWADDPRTELILLYLESFGNPRKFGRLARRVSRRKPILALKSGGSRAGARAASSHTAAFAGSEIAVEALFRQAGVLRARTLEEMLDVAALLASQPLPAGQRVGVLTNAGGFGILCADACESAGLELPAPTEETRRRLASILPPEASVENPIDLQGAAGPEAYQRALPILLADPRLDAVIVLHASPLPERAEAVAAALLRAVPARGAKPVLACLVGSEPAPAPLTQGRIPRFSYPEAAARALGLAAERSAWLRRPAGSIPALEGADRAAAKAIVAGPPRWLEPAEVKALLAAYAIRFAEERAEGAVELIAGLVQDPVFGPLVAFGRRGAMSARLAPLTDVDAAELVAAGELGAALEPLDRGALTELAHRLSRLGDEIPEVAELELSPIVAGPAGCAVVQARARVAAPEPRLGRKTW